MTDENSKEEKPKSEIEVLTTELEVTNSLVKKLSSSVEALSERLSKFSDWETRFKNDLNMSQYRDGYRKSTRELAQQAYDMAQVETRFDGLHEHKVIKAIIEEQEKMSEKFNTRMNNMITNFERWKVPAELTNVLEGLRLIKKMQESINDNTESINTASDTRYDLDKRLKTLETQEGHYQECIDAKLEFFMHHITNAFIFISGALASMGAENTAKAMKEFLDLNLNREEKEPDDIEETKVY